MLILAMLTMIVSSCQSVHVLIILSKSVFGGVYSYITLVTVAVTVLKAVSMAK